MACLVGGGGVLLDVQVPRGYWDFEGFGVVRSGRGQVVEVHRRLVGEHLLTGYNELA